MIHIVKAGDKIQNIASNYGTTVEAIKLLNPALNVEELMEEERILIAEDAKDLELAKGIENTPVEVMDDVDMYNKLGFLRESTCWVKLTDSKMDY